ncbi:MAG TPA: DUF4384 domain-containing protein [Gemmatimonadales bacterium]|nr:DUF4384 domain-containing protein [Gemmatimonadales bacterium]
MPAIVAPALWAGLVPIAAPPPVSLGAADPPRVVLWIPGEDVVRRGDRIRVHVRTDENAYLTVARVDTDGRLRILSPAAPWDDAFVRGGRLLELAGADGDPAFVVDEPRGIGYLLAVASAEPFDYDLIRRGDHWDYRAIAGGRVRGDPYVALADLAAAISPGDYDYDVVPYHVEERHDYPRFVCYECHTQVDPRTWDPYDRRCVRFRIVIYDDPAYYPYRAFGGRAVAGRPRRPAPRFAFKDASPDDDYLTRARRRPVPREDLAPADRRPEDRRRTLREAPDHAAPDADRPRRRDSATPRRERSVERAPTPPGAGGPELRRRRPS